MSKRSVKKNSVGFPHFKNHLIPSATGGLVAYLLSGVVLLALGVFASVWVANMVNHKLHNKA